MIERSMALVANNALVLYKYTCLSSNIAETTLSN